MEADLSWLDKAFGVAYRGQRKDVTGKTIIFPETYENNKDDRYVLFPNDKYKAYSFVDVLDPVEFIYQDEAVKSIYHAFKYNIAIIIYCNLNRIDNTNDLRSVQANIEQDIINCLARGMDAGKFILKLKTKYNRDISKIFEGYDISKVGEQFLAQPYCGFRFECELYLREGCYSANTYIKTKY